MTTIENFFIGGDVFSVKNGCPLDGMPQWANLCFTLKGGDSELFTGLGLYGVFFDDRLIYVGKFLGKKVDPFEGDVRDARWIKHLGSMTLRARNISFSKRSTTQILAATSLEPQAEIVAVDNGLLTRDRGCLSTFNRFMFAAEHWEDFKCVSNETINRFGFGYVRLTEYAGSALDVRKLVSSAEEQVVSRLRPRCNAVVPAEASLHDVIYDQFLIEVRQALGSHEGTVEGGSLTIDLVASDSNEEANVDSMANAETAFYERLDAAPDESKKVVSSLVEAFAGDPYVEIHYKCPETPQMRIRDLRKIPGKPSQNVFTLQWQPRKKQFFCRALAEVAYCQAQVGTDVQRTSDGEPLRSEFNFPTSENASKLTTIVKESIRSRSGV